jgi:SAM-dependent methyltransferase
VALAPPGCGAVRADAAHGLPLLSHSVDLAIVTALPDDGIEPLVEELRRVLAPGGAVRALASVAAAYRLVGELHATAFHAVEAVRLDGAVGVRATAPR